MGRVVTDPALLTNPQDGERFSVQVPSGRREELTYFVAAGAHGGPVAIGSPYFSLRQVNGFGVAASGDPTNWRYPSRTDGLVGVDDSFGFKLRTEDDAQALAGVLTLQEKLVGAVRPADATVPSWAMNWYDLDEGDQFLTPLPENFGLRLVGEPTPLLRHNYATGWQTSPVGAPLKAWYPDLYGLGGGSGSSVRRMTARYRWAWGDLPGAPAGASSDGSRSRPPVDPAKLWFWVCADHIPLADGGTVAAWTDYSGQGGHLSQATAGHRPTLVRNALNGHACARFDGVDDILTGVAGTPISAQPWSLYAVLKQNGGGSTQQVWLGNNTSGAPLMYRGDGADQVNFWTGGSDILYHRASVWPMPPTVMTFVADGASSQIRESNTVKVTGNPGGAGLVGLAVGGQANGSLPAHIDVYEVIVAAGAQTDQQHADVYAYLQAKYAL